MNKYDGYIMFKIAVYTLVIWWSLYLSDSNVCVCVCVCCLSSWLPKWKL